LRHYTPADPEADIVARYLFNGDAANAIGAGASFPATVSGTGAGYEFASVPYLPASFNRKKPLSCAASVRRCRLTLANPH
jgi:hypothetical protein